MYENWWAAATTITTTAATATAAATTPTTTQSIRADPKIFFVSLSLSANVFLFFSLSYLFFSPSPFLHALSHSLFSLCVSFYAFFRSPSLAPG
jgi:hypothetical protein